MAPRAKVVDPYDQIIPFVAITATVTLFGHAIAALQIFRTFERTPELLCAIGFTIFSIATCAGIVRWSIGGKRWRWIHERLVDLTVYCGFPLMGSISTSFLLQTVLQLESEELVLPTLYALVPLLGGLLSRKTSRMVVGLLYFALPLALHAVFAPVPNRIFQASVATYIVGSAIVGTDVDRFILGMRRLDLFHILVGVGAYGLSETYTRWDNVRSF